MTQGRHQKKKRLSFGQCPKGEGEFYHNPNVSRPLLDNVQNIDALFPAVT